MNTHIDPLLEIKLVGIKVRTLNSAEMCLDTAQIGKTIERFFKQGMQKKSRTEGILVQFLQFTPSMKATNMERIPIFWERK